MENVICFINGIALITNGSFDDHLAQLNTILAHMADNTKSFSAIEAKVLGFLLTQNSVKLTEFALPYIHEDIWSVLCQLSTSSWFTCLKEIFLEDMILLEVSTGDTHLRMHLPPSFSQDTLLVI